MFEVTEKQLRDWVHNGVLIGDAFGIDSDVPYVVVSKGAYFGQYITSMFVSRVPYTMRNDPEQWCEQLNDFEFRWLVDGVSTCVSEYELWHVVADGSKGLDFDDVPDPEYWETHYSTTPDPDASVYEGCDRFSDMHGVVDYVRVSLGNFYKDFDVWAIASDVSEYLNGWYYVTKNDDEYWRCVVSHALA